MFGISFPELLVVFAVALIALGPERLPEAAKRLGKLAATLRKTSDSVRREFYNAVYTPANELKTRVGTFEQELKAVKDEVTKKISPDPRCPDSIAAVTPPAPANPAPIAAAPPSTPETSENGSATTKK